MRYTREVKIDYSVDVSYSYRIDGNATTGHRIGVSQEYTDKDTAFEKIKRYDVGSTHPVFYNPESPDESVLEPGVQEGKSRDFNTMMRIWLPLIFVFVSLLGIGFFFARI